MRHILSLLQNSNSLGIHSVEQLETVLGELEQLTQLPDLPAMSDSTRQVLRGMRHFFPRSIWTTSDQIVNWLSTGSVSGQIQMRYRTQMPACSRSVKAAIKFRRP